MIEYDEEVNVVGWLQTDEDATITFDVRETADDIDSDEQFVERIAGSRSTARRQMAIPSTP